MLQAMSWEREPKTNISICQHFAEDLHFFLKGREKREKWLCLSYLQLDWYGFLQGACWIYNKSKLAS
jgi:hypothetical protein